MQSRPARLWRSMFSDTSRTRGCSTPRSRRLEPARATARLIAIDDANVGLRPPRRGAGFARESASAILGDRVGPDGRARRASTSSARRRASPPGPTSWRAPALPDLPDVRPLPTRPNRYELYCEPFDRRRSRSPAMRREEALPSTPSASRPASSTSSTSRPTTGSTFTTSGETRDSTRSYPRHPPRVGAAHD